MTLKKHSLFLVLLLVSFYASAQTIGDYRSNAASFNWNATASWQRWNGTTWVSNPTEGYPGQNASGIAGNVTIQNGHVVAANVDVTTNDLGSLTLLGSSTLSMANNIDIDVTGALTLNGTSQLFGTSTSRTLDAGSLIIPATATNARISNIQLSIILDTNIPPNPARTGVATISGLLNMSTTTSTIDGPTTVNVGGTLTLSNDTGVKRFKGRVTVDGTWTSTAITSDDRLIFGGEVITSGTFACGCQ